MDVVCKHYETLRKQMPDFAAIPRSLVSRGNKSKFETPIPIFAIVRPILKHMPPLSSPCHQIKALLIAPNFASPP